ncbi:putative Growth/differentiation factor 8 [Hypsibius exemplaris]|uniref:Growth/differentiation factor 8 n=1 Tax=Hypsibius exemplaris TaxID=2072580 RepID=A0A1W0X703_HYPEX|nr:putative Growth/differentiation factor 8 [Hypsibius exemplaris]
MFYLRQPIARWLGLGLFVFVYANLAYESEREQKQQKDIQDEEESCSGRYAATCRAALTNIQVELVDKFGKVSHTINRSTRTLRDEEVIPGVRELIESLNLDHGIEGFTDGSVELSEEAFLPQNVFVFGKEWKKRDCLANIGGQMYFDVASNRMDPQTMERATMRLFLQPGDTKDQHVHLKIFSINPPKSENGCLTPQEFAWGHIPTWHQANITINMSDYALDNSGHGKWLHFDVTQVVRQWMLDPSTNHGLKVEAFGLHNGHYKNYIVAVKEMDDPTNIWNGSRPHVVISRKSSFRNRRAPPRGDCDPSSNSTRSCCRMPLRVKFASLKGFNFIIWPQSFEASYCTGRCSSAYVAQSAFGDPFTDARDKQETSHHSCCIATSKLGLHVVYYDLHENIISGILPGVQVQRCGCT